MNIYIGIISYNTKELLADCLDSILSQDAKLASKVVVVDNASSDGTQDFVKKNYPNIGLIENFENHGFAKAANQIIRASKDKYILVLNADTTLTENSIKKLVGFLEDFPIAGAVGPLLLNTDGTVYPSGRKFPSFLEASFHAFFGVIAPNNKITRRYKMLDWDRKSMKEVDWISGAAICLRREAVEEIGCFDEQYFMYVEDMDLCYRLWQNGWKVFLNPDSIIMHYVGQSSKQANVEMLKEFEKSIYRFYVKENKGKAKGLLAPFIKLGLKLRTLFLISLSKSRSK